VLNENITDMVLDENILSKDEYEKALKVKTPLETFYWYLIFIIYSKDQ
tara:strand:+ start:77 stop:220 length:144 start_codon:yes stop_codon:yes gene_type:complete